LRNERVSNPANALIYLPERRLVTPDPSAKRELKTPGQKPVNKLLDTLADIRTKVTGIAFHVKR
jgi:hypothetical protein